MTMTWLPGATVHDLHPAIGNGPFAACYGVILHVNVSESGTPDSFWGNGNPGQVCPNFQVYKDGSIHQMLPLDWQPWCQIDGNFNYAAIETAGMPTEPLTDAQLHACATILRAYHTELNVPLKLANAPGEHGLGTHEMGGAAWGGHPCPGTIRAGQRSNIIAIAAGTEVDMPLTDADAAVLWGHPLSDGTDTQPAAAWLKQARDEADSANKKADALASQVKALQSQVSSMQTAGVDPAALAKEIAAHVAVTLAAK